MREPVIVAQSSDNRAVTDSAAGWSYLFVLGIGLAVVGLVDAVLLFIPAHWSSLEWEFGTVAGMFDAMPLLAIGIGLMTAASVANDWALSRKLMVAVTLLLTVLVVVLSLVFALDVAPILKATGDQASKDVLKMAALKTGLMAMTYTVLYLALGVWTWRRLRVKKGA